MCSYWNGTSFRVKDNTHNVSDVKKVRKSGMVVTFLMELLHVRGGYSHVYSAITYCIPVRLVTPDRLKYCTVKGLGYIKYRKYMHDKE
jgi:hypothetical protein